MYYPLGGAVANVLSKYIPGAVATAEVTGASIDNMKLTGADKADIAFTMRDFRLSGENPLVHMFIFQGGRSRAGWITTSTECFRRSSTRGIARSGCATPSTVTLVSPFPANCCRTSIS